MEEILTTIEEAKRYVHNQYDNILIEDVNLNGEYCYIFFSSNGICDENSVETYIEEMVNKQKYEWRSIAESIKKRRDTGRVIFVRDAYKFFYIHGVSSELCDIKKTIDYLRMKTSDRYWKIVTIGISSGGYMSTLAGISLGAYKMYNISGQFKLELNIPDRYNEFVRINPDYGDVTCVIEKYCNNTNNAPIYYFCPIGCEHDYRQYLCVKDYPCIRAFVFPDMKHAATVYPFNFPDILTATRGKMEKLYYRNKDRIISKKLFLLESMTVIGWLEFFKRSFGVKLRIDRMKKIWDVK